MSDHFYKLKYQLTTESGAFSNEEARAANEATGAGFADAMVLISVMHPPDGSYSQLVLSKDGATEEPLDPRSLFKVWLVMGMELATKEGLDAYRKSFAKMVVDSFMEITKRMRESQEQ